MAVTNEHLDYANNKLQWKKCRDAIAGQKAIKAAGELYLPKLTGQDKTKYEYYSSFGTYANYSARTLDALSGMIFNKDPQIELPTIMDEWAEDITKTGKTLIDFAEDIISEQLTTGRVGILVDYPTVDTSNMSRADVAALDLRPYPTIYTAESIINWRYDVDNKKLQFVILAEKYEDETTDEFVYEIETRYRVLDLIDGVYRVRIYEDISETNSVEDYQPVAEFYPKMNGQFMTEIPFIVVGVQSLGYEVQKPPLIDLIELNISHYRFTVDNEYAAHKTAIPTPVITGHTIQEGDTLELGDNALVLDNPSAKASFLEFTGQGLSTIENMLTKKEYQMSVLGARMLADEKKSAESTQTLEIRTGGERSILASMAKTASFGIKKTLEIIRDWSGNTGDITFILNTEYTAKDASPQYLTALMGLWQGGAITQETLYNNLQKLEITDPQISWETYQSQIQIEAPQMSVPPETQATNSNTGIIQSVRSKIGL